MARTFLITLGLIAVPSVTNVAICEKLFGSGNTTSITSNKEMNCIMEIVKSLEEYGLLIKEKMKKNEGKQQNLGFIGMLLATSAATILGNLWTGKGTMRAGKGNARAGKDFWFCLIF